MLLSVARMFVVICFVFVEFCCLVVIIYIRMLERQGEGFMSERQGEGFMSERQGGRVMSERQGGGGSCQKSRGRGSCQKTWEV